MLMYPVGLMRGSRKFCQRGSKFDNLFFLVDEGIKDQKNAINGPSSAFKWLFVDVLMMAQH